MLAPLGLITAILFYFGYTSQRAYYQYFGLDLGSLGFSTTDYLVGSAQVAFLPLASMLLAALVMIAFHLALNFLLQHRGAGWSRAAYWTSAGLAVALLVLAIAGLGDVTAFRSGYSALIPPIALCLGALLLAYSMYLAERHFVLPTELREALDTMRVVSLGVLTGISLVGAFWATAVFAEHRGTVAARAVELSLPVEARAVIYSKERLFITGPGIELTELHGSDSAYAYRYAGLRLLVHTNNRWFLVPAAWTRTNESPVIILPDSSDDIRVDLAP